MPHVPDLTWLAGKGEVMRVTSLTAAGFAPQALLVPVCCGVVAAPVHCRVRDLTACVSACTAGVEPHLLFPAPPREQVRRQGAAGSALAQQLADSRLSLPVIATCRS